MLQIDIRYYKCKTDIVDTNLAVPIHVHQGQESREKPEKGPGDKDSARLQNFPAVFYTPYISARETLCIQQTAGTWANRNFIRVIMPLLASRFSSYFYL